MPAFTPTYVPQTELDAVNQMLLSIGEAPVSTLSVTNIKDVSFARLTLHNASREVQTEGWDFNTDTDYPLVRDTNDKVAVPSNVLSIDPTDRCRNYVERFDSGVRRLYDKDERTFVLTADVDVDITWFFPFEELPQAARAYIAHKAGRVFQANIIGSQILYQYTKEREIETRADLEREHLLSADENIFNQPTAAAWIARRQPGYRRRW
jgi:hypothetical protein